MVIETRNQVGQGRLAAAGAADQGDHLPRFGAEANIVEHRLLGARVLEAQIAHLQTAADPLKLDRAAVDLGGFVELFEDAVGGSQAFLDVGADLGELADRLGQQAGGGDVGHQIARRGIAAQQ
ncbi:hypothetical protein D9M68_877790 [compost metagenome]